MARSQRDDDLPGTREAQSQHKAAAYRVAPQQSQTAVIAEDSAYPAPVPLLRFGQAFAAESSVRLVQRTDDNEVRTLLVAERLKHSAKSKYQILRGNQNPFGMRMKWTLARGQFAHVVRGNIERSNSTGINQFVEIRIEIGMFTDRGDVLHQVSSSHIAVIRRIDDFQLKINSQFGSHL